MELLKAGGVQLTVYLQDTYIAQHALSLHLLLGYFTSPFILSFVCPLLLAVQGGSIGNSGVTIGSATALQVIWTTIVSLRLNTFKQWVFGEDRPYWWVKETPYYANQRPPALRHYPTTCLSSPAAPTHTLLAAGVGLILIHALVDIIKRTTFSKPKHQAWAVGGVYAVFVSVLALVGLGDFFFSSHFPHQVLVSHGLGLVIGTVMLSMDFTKGSSYKRTIAINCTLLSISLFTMYQRDAVTTMNSYQEKAFRWCVQREWLQLDPTPLLDVFIFTGYAIGTAVATNTRYYKKLNKSKWSYKMLVSLCALNLLAARVVHELVLAVPVTATSYYLYPVKLLGTAAIPLCCAALLPYFVQVASKIQPAKGKKL